MTLKLLKVKAVELLISDIIDKETIKSCILLL